MAEKLHMWFCQWYSSPLQFERRFRYMTFISTLSTLRKYSAIGWAWCFDHQHDEIFRTPSSAVAPTTQSSVVPTQKCSCTHCFYFLYSHISVNWVHVFNQNQSAASLHFYLNIFDTYSHFYTDWKTESAFIYNTQLSSVMLKGGVQLSVEPNGFYQ